MSPASTAKIEDLGFTVLPVDQIHCIVVCIFTDVDSCAASGPHTDLELGEQVGSLRRATGGGAVSSTASSF